MRAMPASGPPQLGQLLELLGYSQDEDYLPAPFLDDVGAHRHALESAAAEMGVVGALCVRTPLGGVGRTRVPLLYVATAVDEADADDKHRQIWSQSLAPLLLVATPAGAQLRNGFNLRGHGRTVPWTDVGAAPIPRALAGIRSTTIRSSMEWARFDLPSNARVDERLHKAIRALYLHLLAKEQALGERPAAVNALIGWFIYLYVLVDRGLLTQGWIDRLRRQGRPACPSVRLDGDPHDRRPWAVDEVWALFDNIDAVLNGSIFPIPAADRKAISSETIDLVRRVIRSDALDEAGQQFGFLDAQFGAIRTETISAIYELFFELKDGEQRSRAGAFYTPPFLVDYVLDETDAIAAFDPSSHVVDPTCGSGTFLVGAFRRIVEAERRRAGPPDAGKLRELLSTCIHGAELDGQAVNVARFSLYLTMLDYLPDATLETLENDLGAQQLFPDMRRNVRHADAFGAVPVKLRRSATHVVGNPPWTPAPKNSAAWAYRQSLPADRPVSRDEMAELVTWHSLQKLAAPGAVVALILPAKSFVSPKAKVFPRALAANTRLNGVTSLAHFRRTLFPGATTAAVIVFLTNEAYGEFDWTWTYSPVPANQPLSRGGQPWAIVVDRGNVEVFRQADIAHPTTRWDALLLLAPLDRALLRDLNARLRATGLPRFGDFLLDNRMAIGRGGSTTETGMPRGLLLDAGENDYRRRLRADQLGGEPYLLPPRLLDDRRDARGAVFRGPTLVFTRTMNDPLVVPHPVAFASTLNGVGYLRDEDRHDGVATLQAIGRFFGTALTQYLMALFGRGWVLDERRFEALDVKQLPFPYTSRRDLADAMLDRSDEDILVGFAERLGLSPLFVAATLEHGELRKDYQNGRQPSATAVAPATDEAIENYRIVLQTELVSLLPGTDDRRDISVRRSGDTSCVVTVAPGRDPPKGTTATIPLALASQAQVATDGSGAVTIVKPAMTSAWTVERAYADASAVLRHVLGD